MFFSLCSDGVAMETIFVQKAIVLQLFIILFKEWFMRVRLCIYCVYICVCVFPKQIFCC